MVRRTFRDVRAMPAKDLRALSAEQVAALSASQQRLYLRLLAADVLFRMTRQEVAALSPAQRQARREALEADETWWSIGDIADAFGVGEGTVGRWRWRRNVTGKTSKSAMPLPLRSHPGKRRPGSPGRRVGGGGRPRWRAPDMRRWGRQTGRLDLDFFPMEQEEPSPGPVVPEQRSAPGRRALLAAA